MKRLLGRQAKRSLASFDYDVFICHDCPDSSAQITLMLNNRDLIVAASDTEGTVKDSRVFLLFLSNGIFRQDYTKRQLLEALKLEREVVIVYQPQADIDQILSQLPEDIENRIFQEGSVNSTKKNWIAFYTREPRRSKTIKALARRFPTARKTKVEKYDPLKQLLAEYEKGTREWIFDSIACWFNSASNSSKKVSGEHDVEGFRDQKGIFMLLGYAGVGKSVFAAALAAGMDKRISVAGYHFFDHHDQQTNTVRSCIESISKQMEATIPGFKETIRRKKKFNTVDVTDVESLVWKFITEPLSRMNKGLSNRVPNRTIIVLDAVDECSGNERDELIKFIYEKWTKVMPNWLGVFITARPEIKLPSNSQRFEIMHLRTDEDNNVKDIRRYLEEKWKAELPSSEYEAGIDMLVDRCEGSFLYAKFLSLLLRDKQHPQQTGDLDSKPITLKTLNEFPVGLSGVYEKYFGRFLQALGKQNYDDFLSLVLASRGPLPIPIWLALGNLREENAIIKEKAMQLLTFSGNTIRFVHKSMRKWLSSVEGELSVPLARGHKALACFCWEQMQEIADPDSLDAEEESVYSFALANVIYHLCLAERYENARTLIADFQWLLRRVTQSVDIASDIEKYYLPRIEGDDREVRLTASVIRLAKRILGEYPQQLASQILARIDASDQDAKSIREQAYNYKPGVSWWRPIVASLEKAESPLLQVISGHDKPIDALAVSSFKNQLASGGRDGKVFLWDVATGDVEQVCFNSQEKVKDVNSVAFSPDGTRVAAGYDDGEIIIWSATTGEEIERLRGLDKKLIHKKRVWCVSYAPDGDVLVSVSEDGTIILYSTINKRLACEPLGPFQNAANSVAFSHDGKHLVAGFDDKVIRSWKTDEVMNGKIKHVEYDGHRARVRSVQFSPKTSDLLVSCSDDKQVIIWRAETQTPVHILSGQDGHDGRVYGACFSPDARFVASASADRTVRLWDVNTGKLLYVFEGHADPTMKVAFIDKNRLVSASLDKTIRMWNVETALVHKADGGIAENGHAKWVVSVAVSVNGKYVVTGSQDNNLCVWDADTANVLRTLRGHTSTVWHVIVCPKSELVGSGSPDSTFRIWDIETGTNLHTLRGHGGSVSGIAFAHKKDYAASGSMDQVAKLWCVSTGTLVRTFEGHTSTIAPVCFSSDDTMLVTGSSDESARIWDVETGDLLQILGNHAELIRAISISMDGRIVVTGCDDGVAFVWNREKPLAPLHKLKRHKNQLRSAVISEDGTKVITTDRLNNIVVWSTKTGKELEDQDPTLIRIPYPTYETDGMQGLPLLGTGLLTKTPKGSDGIGFSVDIGTLNTRKLTNLAGDRAAIAEGDKIHIVELA